MTERLSSQATARQQPAVLRAASRRGRADGRRPQETVLLVASCAGPRCRALRHLHDTTNHVDTSADRETDTDTGHRADTCGEALRAAVRDRPRAVLVSTACLGPCHWASLVAVGWAAATGDGRLDWIGPPRLLSMLDAEDRAAAAAAWIRDAAPRLDRLPAQFADPSRT